MVAVVVGGTREFNALCYPEQHPGTRRFFDQQFDRASQVVGAMGDYAMGFFNRAKEAYETTYNSDAVRHARAVARLVGGAFQRDRIQPLRKMEDFQTAGMRMQRWIMAEPTVRQLYHEQGCDGYSNTYVDMEPGKVGVAHYDYRRVMNGIVNLTTEELEDGTVEHGWSSTTWGERLKEGDVELDFDEQATVINCWAALKTLVGEGGEDPVSVYGTML